MVAHLDRIDAICEFWFGRVEETIVPSENRARIWFSEDPEMDAEIKANFYDDHQAAVRGDYVDWISVPRGQLALILLFDQFSRHIYRQQAEAYSYDGQALEICLQGINNGDDHKLSLIERVFYYFPLLHSEELTRQEKSLECYQLLTDIAFSETRMIYKSFLKFSNHHYSVIEQFGRFPQRNIPLGRDSTPSELTYMAEIAE